MNQKITKLITQSINTLKTTLSVDELAKIKATLTSIYYSKISTSGGWHKIKTEEQISADKLKLIEYPFYYIGSLSSNPPRGPIKILRDAYSEDITSPDERPFVGYQWEVMGYVHDQVDEAF
ncbi:hypothetical protein [Rickettsia endosymbiont of Polydrusus tereticollis]|uniref:hypothetical protein n=1 Tax=Rickettsia endosymbiont of Polydrusus tereticollis TaxID=3066251 RepID=UPI0031329B81